MEKNSETKTVSVVIAALNEGATIGAIIAAIKAVGPSFEVIVVDDGSTDDTAAQAAKAGAKVIRHPYNLGNGASIKAAVMAAQGDVVVMIDADGQHPPEAIPSLLEPIGEYDMTVGARIPGSNTSRVRRFGNFFLNFIGSWISGRKIDDLTSGFRAIKRKPLLEYLHLFPRRFSYPTTITMAMIQGNYFVKFVPVPGIKRREFGQSSIKPISDFLRFINIMARLVIVFSPQRFFLPLSLTFVVCGLLMATYQIVKHGAVLGSSVLLLISGLLFFCFGLIAEQIAALRRERAADRG